MHAHDCQRQLCVKYVLAAKSSQATPPIFAGMLVGTLLSILIWMQVAKRLKNNQLMLILCSFVLALFALPPLSFLSSATSYVVAMALWGGLGGFGGFWTFMSPAMADVIDSLIVVQKRRDDGGVVLGIRAFFMRFSYASQALVFFIVHKATAFDPPLAITEQAIWGAYDSTWGG